MGKTATNLSVILGLITMAFAGYYIYTQQTMFNPDFDTNEEMMQAMLSNTAIFIERSETLSQVHLGIDLFEDSRFLSLRSYTSPIQSRPIGRPDPFAEVNIRPDSNF